MSVNEFLCQFQADVLGVPVSRPQVRESTAMGAALLAGLGVGVWSGLEQVAASWRRDRRFDVRMDTDERQARMAAWHEAVARARTPPM